MPQVSPQHYEISVGSTRTVTISFDDELASGETLSSTTVAEVTTSDLTISGAAVNASTVDLWGETIAIGKAVQFRVSGGLAASSPYTIRTTCPTSASQVLVADIKLSWV